VWSWQTETSQIAFLNTSLQSSYVYGHLEGRETHTPNGVCPKMSTTEPLRYKRLSLSTWRSLSPNPSWTHNGESSQPALARNPICSIHQLDACPSEKVLYVELRSTTTVQGLKRPRVSYRCTSSLLNCGTSCKYCRAYIHRHPYSKMQFIATA
jgi:hypothetical protein